MSEKSILKSFFQSGDRPTATEFADLIDSSLNFYDDKASDADAENSTVDNKFITPKTAKKAVEKFAPVKTVNGQTPDAAGLVTIQISHITNLQAGLNSKQPTLLSGSGGNIKTINNGSILIDPTNPSVTDIHLATQADLDLKMNVAVVTKVTSTGVTGNTTRADVSGMSFDAMATKKYKIEIIGDYQGNSSTAGGSMGFTISGGSGTIRGRIEMQTSASSTEKKIISVINTANTSADSYMNASPVGASTSVSYCLSAVLYFECSAAGTFKLQWGAAGTGTTKLNGGTVMIVNQLN